MIGREVSLPGDINPLSNDHAPHDESQYVDKLRERLYYAHEIVRTNLKRAFEKQQRHLQPHTHIYKEGDLIWYLNEVTKDGECPKLQPAYVGPYVVLKNLNDINLLIQKGSKGKQVVVHHDKLKPYHGNEKPAWAKNALKKLTRK